MVIEVIFKNSLIFFNFNKFVETNNFFLIILEKISITNTM